jgi:hypothetical protein
MSIGFVQAGFLLALAGLAIPLLLHFTHRSRPQLAELGSIRFLREILERTRNRRRLMRWLLLSLRIAFVGFLAVLFARPYLPQRVVGGEDQLAIVLVDGSGSMRFTRDGASSFDRARDAAATLLAEIPPGARVETAWFADRVTPVDHETLESQEPSFAVTDYAAALRWAADVTRQSTAAAKHVHLITDLQQSGLQWSDAASMPADVSLHVHDVMSTDANNVVVTSAAPQRVVVRPGQAAVVDATISNFGPFTLEEALITLTLRQANRPVRVEQRVRMPAGGAEQVRFTTPPLAAGVWQGAVSIEAVDDLMVDNVRHVALLAAPPLGVLLVDGDVREADFLSETYFLNLALRLAPAGEEFDISPFAPDRASSRDEPLPDLKPYAAVVLANVSGMSSGDAQRLSAFVRAGGGLLVFGGDRVTAEGCRTLSQAGLLPGAISPNRVAEDLPFRIASWDKAHSILAPFADPQHGDLQRLTFRGITPLAPVTGATVLAECGDGTPTLVEQSVGAGRVLWFASACDLNWSDWPRGSLFVPLVHQMMGRLTGLNDGGPVRSVLVDGSSNSSASPGVFERGNYWQVVNVDPRESETARCLESDLRTRFAAAAPASEGDSGNADENASRVARAGTWGFRQNEFWHWIVVALVGLAALEFVVGNRVAA